MSSPIEHLDTLLGQDISNSSFQHPPTHLNNEIDNSIIKDNISNNNNNNNNEKVIIDKKDLEESEDISQSPIPLTQTISDDEIDNIDNNVNDKIETVQFKGQPVWQLNVNGIKLTKRMNDLKFNWNEILLLIENINNINNNNNNNSSFNKDDLVSKINSHYEIDINNDIWIPNDDIIKISNDYNINKYLLPLINISSINNEKKRVNNNNNNNNEKIINDKFKSPKKKIKLDNSDSLNYYDLDIKKGNPNFPFTLKPLSNDNLINEQSKVIISSLFLPFQDNLTLNDILKDNNNNNNKLKDDEDNDNIPIINKDNINIDVPIDDNGQTALHLAATLGKISLVKELIEKGSNRFRGDNDGQTALIRVVHATNCFELSCFDKLLDLLYPSIKLLDNKGRSILHHISLTCGLKGRYDASKYYLETLLEWVVKKGSKLQNDSSLTLTNFIKEVVNKSDKYGNTCLNYATLGGNKYIVSQLLDICADPFKANKIGVTPGDWGINVNNNNENLNNENNNLIKNQLNEFENKIINNNKDEMDEKIKIENKFNNNNNNNNETDDKSDINKNKDNNVNLYEKELKNEPNINNEIKNNLNNDNKIENKDKDNNDILNINKFNIDNTFKEPSNNSFEILNSIQSFISTLNIDLKEELNEKSKQIDKLNPILKDKALQLSQKRKQFDELQKMIKIISKITNKIENLNKAINEEENLFQKEIENSNINIDQDNCLGDFDADQPFTILPLYNNVEEIVEKILNDKLERIRQEKKLKKEKENKEEHEEKDNKEEDDDEEEEEEEEENNNEFNNNTMIDILNSIKAENILPLLEKKLNDSSKEEIKKNMPPSVVLDARIRAYKKNNEILMNKMINKRNSNKELESQFKRIIGLCIGTDADKIDDRLLSSLLMSVETDPDPEIGQIKKVLKIVGDLDGEDNST